LTLAYGKQGLPVEIPDRNLVKILRMRDKQVIGNTRGVTLERLSTLPGHRRLLISRKEKNQRSLW